MCVLCVTRIRCQECRPTKPKGTTDGPNVPHRKENTWAPVQSVMSSQEMDTYWARTYPFSLLNDEQRVATRWGLSKACEFKFWIFVWQCGNEWEYTTIGWRYID